VDGGDLEGEGGTLESEEPGEGAADVAIAEEGDVHLNRIAEGGRGRGRLGEPPRGWARRLWGERGFSPGGA